MQEAKLSAVALSIEAALQELGLTHLQGVPFRAWLTRKTNEETQRLLIAMEDMNPGAAAATQQAIDDAVKRPSSDAGPSSSSQPPGD
jgi:hypothetical protein